MGDPANIKRCQIIKNTFKNREGLSADVLSFFVRDALFSDFCIMCPEPRIIKVLNEIYSAFERIHHWQRVKTDLTDKSAGFIVGYANDFFKTKKLHNKYNELSKVLAQLSPDIDVPPEYNIKAIK